jgi:hypothetical protein
MAVPDGMSRGSAESPPVTSQRGPLGNKRHVQRSEVLQKLDKELAL